MIGYLEFYFKITVKNTGEVNRGNMRFDFSKFITQDFFDKMIEDMAKAYQEEFKLDVKIETISKEEYQSIDEGDWNINRFEWGE